MIVAQGEASGRSTYCRVAARDAPDGATRVAGVVVQAQFVHAEKPAALWDSTAKHI